MILGIPVYENHALTAAAVASIATTARGMTAMVIIDNGSPRPYRTADFGSLPFPLRVIRSEHNLGNFWPLGMIAAADPLQSVVAIAHNDIVIHEVGWDRRVERAFRDDPKLGGLGFVGSPGVDHTGMRDRTESNFRGTHGHARAEQIGTRVTGLSPAAAIDGLFMAFRRSVLPSLWMDESLPPAHYVDFIWGAQVQLAGWRLATLGIECDHVGWSTEVKLARSLDVEWRRWCALRGLDPGPSPMVAIRAYGMGRWDSFRGSFWPCRVGPDWVWRLQ